MPEATTTPAGASPEEIALLQRLRDGDESAFARLVEDYSPGLLRLALTYVPSRAVAEEVVQETWLGVLNGLDRFEGRSTLKTWIYRILSNTAKTRGQRESRSIPFSSLARTDADEDGGGPLDADSFSREGHWASIPDNWAELPEQRLLGRETLEIVEAAIEALPPAQREVITLRDLQGFSSEEVCALLAISEGNQRVILHRARSRVRRALDDHLAAV